MKLFDLFEGADAPLYHATSIYGAIRILECGYIEAGENREDGMISTTRDVRLRYYNAEGVDIYGIAPVQFQIDQRKVRQRFKVGPVDFWTGGNEKRVESEEYIKADQLPLAYISAVILMPLPEDFKNLANEYDTEYVGRKGVKSTAYKEIIRLAKEHGIRVDDRRPKKMKPKPQLSFTGKGWV